MSRSLSLPRLFVLTLIVAILTSASSALPGNTQSAVPVNALTTSTPVTVFPNSTVPIKRMIHIWTTVSGATQYQLQVYQDATLILSTTYDASPCVSGTCSVRHDIDLANAAYIWQVRAMVGGVWQAYSAWQGFSVLVADVTGGFSSPFTSNAEGWMMHKGLWNLESSNYFTTVGVAGKASSISHLNDYSTLTYEVRMKRTGCTGCANVIIIRGNPVLDSVGWWNTEYTLNYTNTGLFSVWRDYYGSYTPLKNWTSTTAIVKGGWNTLKVIADGPSLYFYINNVLVWTGSDSTYSSGRVGIGMYRNSSSTGNKLYVDWAQLSTTANYAAERDLMMVTEPGEEIPGGDRNMAP